MKYSAVILLLIISSSLFAQKEGPDPLNEYAYLTKYKTHYKNEQEVEAKETSIVITGNHKKQQLTVGKNVISYKALRVYDDAKTYKGNYRIIECIAFDSDNRTLHLNTLLDIDNKGRVILILGYMDGETYIYQCEILY